LTPFPRSDTDELRAGSLTVRLDLVAGAVTLTGVLDRSTAHLLHDSVSTLLSGGVLRWELDAEGLVHCDASGLRAIGTAYRRALAHDRRVVVRSAPPWLCSALGRVRLDSHVLG
jgi:anti-anti-sigma regulatory factor